MGPEPRFERAGRLDDLGVNAQIVTQKYQKSIDGSRYNLSADGSLVIV